jgi:hypothetical protein
VLIGYLHAGGAALARIDGGDLIGIGNGERISEKDSTKNRIRS